MSRSVCERQEQPSLTMLSLARSKTLLRHDRYNGKYAERHAEIAENGKIPFQAEVGDK